jgi:hypothetical protein
MNVYNPVGPAFCIMFSKRRPAQFSRVLQNRLREKDVEAKIDAKRWIFTFVIVKEQDD